VRTVSEFLEKNTTLEQVIFVCFDDENYKIYQAFIQL